MACGLTPGEYNEMPVPGSTTATNIAVLVALNVSVVSPVTGSCSQIG